MGQLMLQGSITVGPAVVTETTFPGAVSQVSLSPMPSPKPSQVDTGIKTRNVNSSNAYVALSGAGTGDDVTQGDTLYLRTRSPMLLRLTWNNPLQPGSPTVLAGIPIQGTKFEEYPSDRYLMLIEVQGVGQIEYLVSGQQ